MSVVIELVIYSLDSMEASAVAAEQLHDFNRKAWDDSDETCERILTWLRLGEPG